MRASVSGLRWVRRLVVLAATLAWAAQAGWSQKQPEASEPPSVAWKVIAGAPASAYAGAKRCEQCHRAEYLEFEKTSHADAMTPEKTGAGGCEVCHGPGKAHAEAEEAAAGDDAKQAAATKLIFSFHDNPEENSDRCMRCHITSKGQDLFNHSEHATRGVWCGNCHAMHLVEAAEHPGRRGLEFAQAQFFSVPKLPQEVRWLESSLLKKPQPDLCVSCHTNIQAQFALPFHHRVPEGLMKCTDCHTPHGSMNLSQLREANSETCVRCHVGKRGPFVFEHAAVKIQGCVACHSPHGSVNQHLLVRREERLLCLQCHVEPFAANVPHGRLTFQARGTCTRCHVTIHGSNFSEFFLQ